MAATDGGASTGTGAGAGFALSLGKASCAAGAAEADPDAACADALLRNESAAKAAPPTASKPTTTTPAISGAALFFGMAVPGCEVAQLPCVFWPGEGVALRPLIEAMVARVPAGKCPA